MTSQMAPIIGWREWVCLPDLAIPMTKAKVDTGARSSSLHAINVQILERGGRTLVRFAVHPLQRNSQETVRCEAEVVEFRNVKSSTGHSERRPVISTTLEVLGQVWPIEVTLANRDTMGFRMLLGREAVRGRFLIDPGKSFYSGRPKGRRKKKASRTRGSKVRK